jgi:uncharacterized protein YbaR (Trm112 family)
LIDPALLEILRCPVHPDGPPFIERGPFLICTVDGSGYRASDGIIHLLAEDAVPAAEVERELGAAGQPDTSER